MNIIDHIKARAMTVAAVARISGISRQSIYAMRDMRHNPSVATLVAVCAVVGIHPAAIRPELSE